MSPLTSSSCQNRNLAATLACFNAMCLAKPSDERPSLLTLPPELRSQIFRFVFSSRIIRFAAPYNYGFEETANPGKVYHEWRLGFTGTNRQLRSEGRTALISIIMESTLILDGIFPKSQAQKARLDRSLYTRKMLDSFIEQYGSYVRTLKISDQSNYSIDLDCFKGLRKVVLLHNISVAFEVEIPVPNNSQSSSRARIPLVDFEPSATDEQMQEVICNRWKELKAVQIPGFSYATARSLIERSTDGHELEIHVLLRLVSTSGLRYGSGQSGLAELLVDERSNETLSFTRH